MQDRLDQAIRRTQDYILSTQHPDGYWMGELIVDSSLVSDMVAYHHWNGHTDPEWERKAGEPPPELPTRGRGFGIIILMVQPKSMSPSKPISPSN